MDCSWDSIRQPYAVNGSYWSQFEFWLGTAALMRAQHWNPFLVLLDCAILSTAHWSKAACCFNKTADGNVRPCQRIGFAASAMIDTLILLHSSPQRAFINMSASAALRCAVDYALTNMFHRLLLGLCITNATTRWTTASDSGFDLYIYNIWVLHHCH